jgi:hypothetical protein
MKSFVISNKPRGSATPFSSELGINVYVVLTDVTPRNLDIIYREYSTEAGAMYGSTTNLSDSQVRFSFPEMIYRNKV